MKEKEKEKERLWTGDFIMIMVACAGISFCNYFFLSTMPIYMLRLTGSPVYAGLITLIFTYSALIIRPIAGLLSERYGRTKLLICGAALCAAACVLYQFSGVILTFVLLRVLHGVGFGLHTTAGGAVPADVVPKSRLAEGLGIFGLYGTIASAVAPGIALSVIGQAGNAGFRLLFILAAAIAFVCMILDLFIRYEKKGKRLASEPRLEQKEEAEGSKPRPKALLGFEAGVLLPSAVLLLIFIAMSSISAFLALYAGVEGLGNIGLYFTASAAGMFLSRFFLGKVSDRCGADVVVLPSLGILIICFLLLPLIKTTALLVLLGLPMGLAQGAVCPALNMLLFKRTSASRRGSTSAAYFSAIDIGLGGGALLFGIVAHRLGYHAVFWGAAVAVAAALGVYMVFLQGKK